MKSVIIAVLFMPALALAWGGRGHHSICSAAVHLVQEKGLQEFLKSRPHTMGHLCNVPDIYWKSLPNSKPGNAAHFIDPEITGLTLKEIPLDFATLEKDFTGKPNKFKEGATIFSVPDDFGSMWWRADQFFRLGSVKDVFATAALPKGKEEQDEKFPYNKAAYDLMVNMGLLGHFVGDASQPLHNTADYDGYAAGHGGLHSFYEDQTVAAAPGDLEAKILMKARAIKKAAWLAPGTTIERMRALSETGIKELPQIFKKDPIKKKSEVKKEKGMDLRTAAVRESGAKGWERFGDMITGQMGRSAKLLALFWDEMYANAGRPDLSAYRSYRYPFTPDYVPLDYVSPEEKKEAAKN